MCVEPVPLTVDQIADRLGSVGSLGGLLPVLDADVQDVGRAIAVLNADAAAGTVADLLDAPRPLVDRAVGVLLDHAAAWPDGDRLRLPERLLQHWRADVGGDRAMRKLAAQAVVADLQRAADGLGLDAGARPTKTRLTEMLHAAMTDRPAMVRRIATLPPALGEQLLVWCLGDPIHLQRRHVDALEAQGLLLRSSYQLQMPREVAVAAWLHHTRLHGVPDLPPAPSHPRGAGAAEAMEWLRLVVTVLDDAAVTPIVSLRQGGVGKRERAKLVKRLGLPGDTTVCLVVDLAFAAGLLAWTGDGYVPTEAYDAWRADDAAARWAALASRWFRLPHTPSWRVDHDRKDVAPPLGIPSAHGYVRRALLRAAAPDRSTAAAAAHIGWYCPVHLMPEDLARVTAAAVAEASTLGVVVGDGLRELGQALFTGDDADSVAGAVGELLVDAPCEVVLQSDLTALVSGRPGVATARLLAEAATAETRGTATVFRFSSATVRHAFDLGWDADTLLTALRRLSDRPVPQPLEYLVGDVARRHGEVRLRSAATVLVTTEALAEELLRTRSLKDLALAALAPTVLVSAKERAVVLEKVRAAGHFPVKEDASGAVVVERPRTSRAKRRVPIAPRPSSVAPEEVVRRVSSGSRVFTPRP